MRRNLFIANPFTIFSVLWIFVILLYQLEWSNLYPRLSDNLILFLFFTIIISFFLGFISWKKQSFSFYTFNNAGKYYPLIKKIIKINFLLMIVDIIYSGYIPLFVYANGPASGSTYLEYGMPFIHIIVVNGFSIIFSCSFWLYRNCNYRKTRKAFLKLCGLCMIQPILCFSRAQILFMILSALYIILVSNDNLKKTIIKIALTSIAILYLFGVVGDFRNSGGGENYFVRLAGANDNFYKSNIPTPFFWGYIYFSSPLANVQNMIDTRGRVVPQKEGLGNLFYNNLTPGIIKRRLGMDDVYKAVTTDTSHLIVEELNVGGIYYGAYGSFKWLGVIIVFLYYIFVISFSIYLIPNNSVLKLPVIVILVLITFMSIFSNPFGGDGFIPQLIIAMIAARSSKFRIKYNEKSCNIISHI